VVIVVDEPAQVRFRIYSGFNYLGFDQDRSFPDIQLRYSEHEVIQQGREIRDQNAVAVVLASFGVTAGSIENHNAAFGRETWLQGFLSCYGSQVLQCYASRFQFSGGIHVSRFDDDDVILEKVIESVGDENSVQSGRYIDIFQTQRNFVGYVAGQNDVEIMLSGDHAQNRRERDRLQVHRYLL